MSGQRWKNAQAQFPPCVATVIAAIVNVGLLVGLLCRWPAISRVLDVVQRDVHDILQRHFAFLVWLRNRRDERGHPRLDACGRFRLRPRRVAVVGSAARVS
jgi:hypothetical protein